jgi:hypothetical protein
LLTESQVFEDEVFPGTTSADHPAQEMPEKHDHDQHFIGTVRIEPVAMSFILRVYEVLASHITKSAFLRTGGESYWFERWSNEEPEVRHFALEAT